MFLRKERKLYEESDTIGCMSEANRKYLIDHYDFLSSKKIEVNPNSISPRYTEQSLEVRIATRKKYGLPQHGKILVYGGNLGLPQGIDFLLDTISNCAIQNIFFLIVGAGREYNRISQWFLSNKPGNAKLIEGLPKDDYDSLVKACDIGMIFLNPDFTIPNFPSRILSYLECGMPVLAATDLSTDIGKVIEQAGCGIWVHSGDMKGMLHAINKLIENEEVFLLMKQNARSLLEKEYKVDISYHLIESKVKVHV